MAINSVVPLYIWRFLTGFNPNLDPGRYPRIDLGQTSSEFSILLVTAVVSFQLWYWFKRIPEGTPKTPDCTYYGFLFTKIRLESIVLRVVNIVLLVLHGLILCFALTMTIWKQWGKARQQESTVPNQIHIGRGPNDEAGLAATGIIHKTPHSRRTLVRRSYLRRSRNPQSPTRNISDAEKGTTHVQSNELSYGKESSPAVHKRRVLLLEIMDTVTRVICQVTIIVATELTIQWNQIKDVYTLKSAGQTIPLIVGGGLMLRVFWKAWWRDEAGEVCPHHQKPPRRIEDMAAADAAEEAPLEDDDEIRQPIDIENTAALSFLTPRRAAGPFNFNATAMEVEGHGQSEEGEERFA